MKDFLEGFEMDESLQFASAYSNLLNLHNISEQVANAMEERHKRLQDIPRGTRQDDERRHQRFTSSRQDDGGDLRRDLHATRRFSAHCAPDAGVATIDSQILRENQREFAQTPTLSIVGLRTRRGVGRDSFQRRRRVAHRRTPSHASKTAGRDARRFDVLSTNHLGRYSHLYASRRYLLLAQGCPRLPLTRSIVTFGSWMGGDRDGNPNVTSECTRDVVLLARIQGVNLLFSAIQRLIFDLSMWRQRRRQGARQGDSRRLRVG